MGKFVLNEIAKTVSEISSCICGFLYFKIRLMRLNLNIKHFLPSVSRLVRSVTGTFLSVERSFCEWRTVLRRAKPMAISSPSNLSLACPSPTAKLDISLKDCTDFRGEGFRINLDGSVEFDNLSFRKVAVKTPWYKRIVMWLKTYSMQFRLPSRRKW